MDTTISFIHDDKEVECIVEYILVDDSDDSTSLLAREVVNVFLPEEYTLLDKRELGLLKVKACERFHEEDNT